MNTAVGARSRLDTVLGLGLKVEGWHAWLKPSALLSLRVDCQIWGGSGRPRGVRAWMSSVCGRGPRLLPPNHTGTAHSVKW